MNGGDWSVLDLLADPVRGEPGEVRVLANASQQEARRWEEQVESLRTIADEGNALQMEGDFAHRYRQMLQAHPNDATPLARGRADAGQALLAYAGQLEQAKRESQMALSQGAQARQAHRTAMRAYEQAVAQMNAMPKVVPPQQYPYVLQQFNMLRAQAQRAWQAMQQAEAQWKAARQRAVQAGERAAQQERLAAERVTAAAPARAAATGSRANGGTPSGSATGSGNRHTDTAPPPPTARLAIEAPPRRHQLEAPARHTPGGGLNAHEHLPTLSGNSAGHTLTRHVGQTDAQLGGRLANQPGLDRISTYVDPSEANGRVDQAILANHDDITAWVNNPDAGKRLSYSVNLADNTSVGRVLERGATESTPGHGVQVVLERRPPGSDPPYLVVTSYPIP